MKNEEKCKYDPKCANYIWMMNDDTTITLLTMAMAMMSLMRVMISMMMMTNPHAHLVNLLGQSDARRVHGYADKRLVSMSCNRSELKMGLLNRTFMKCSQRLPHGQNVIVRKKVLRAPAEVLASIHIQSA